MSVAEANPVPARRSCLYECRVLHQRFSPKRHRFEYGIFMLAVDLDELDSLHQKLRLFSRNRANLYEFRDRDHLVTPSSASDLRGHLTAWLATQGVDLPPDGRVVLVTLPRVFGYLFAPVSFYFCHHADGRPIGAVAEVQNTFGELKPYFVPSEPSQDRERFRLIVPKHFYVSPFSPLDLCFDFKLRSPGNRLEIGVNDVAGDQTVLVSTLVGQRRPLTDAELLRLTLRYPLVTLRVIALIHWQALRLWWRRLPWYRKADRPDLQRGIYRPHSSLLEAAGPTPTHRPDPSASVSPLP
jgi:DUF1365 family protein